MHSRRSAAKDGKNKKLTMTPGEKTQAYQNQKEAIRTSREEQDNTPAGTPRIEEQIPAKGTSRTEQHMSGLQQEQQLDERKALEEMGEGKSGTTEKGTDAANTGAMPMTAEKSGAQGTAQNQEQQQICHFLFYYCM